MLPALASHWRLHDGAFHDNAVLLNSGAFYAAAGAAPLALLAQIAPLATLAAPAPPLPPGEHRYRGGLRDNGVLCVHVGAGDSAVRSLENGFGSFVRNVYSGDLASWWKDEDKT